MRTKLPKSRKVILPKYDAADLIERRIKRRVGRSIMGINRRNTYALHTKVATTNWNSSLRTYINVYARVDLEHKRIKIWTSLRTYSLWHRHQFFIDVPLRYPIDLSPWSSVYKKLSKISRLSTTVCDGRRHR